MLRNVLMAATAAVCLVVGSGATTPTAATAQVVYCSNCANQVTQWQQQADQALQLVRQAEQLKVQLDSYNRMIQDGLSLPEHLFGDLVRDITAVNDVFEQAKGLAYTSANLDEQFAARYGSLDSYQQSGMNGAQMQDKYRQWNTEANDSVLQTMRALGIQNRGMASEQDLLRRLQTQARSAQGHQQTLAVANELAAESIAQTQKLRQLTMMSVQLQAQALQLEADRQAAGAARDREFFTPRAPDYTGQTY